MPILEEVLLAEMEPTHVADKYAMAVTWIAKMLDTWIKEDVKTMCFLLHAKFTGSCHVTVKGRAVNLGDKLGQKVSLIISGQKVSLIISGQQQYISVITIVIIRKLRKKIFRDLRNNPLSPPPLIEN